MVFASNPSGLFWWRGGNSDLEFSQDVSIPGQFVRQLKLRITAQEAALKEIAGSKLRRLLAQNKYRGCADVRVGGSVVSISLWVGKVPRSGAARPHLRDKSAR